MSSKIYLFARLKLEAYVTDVSMYRSPDFISPFRNIMNVCMVNCPLIMANWDAGRVSGPFEKWLPKDHPWHASLVSEEKDG